MTISQSTVGNVLNAKCDQIQYVKDLPRKHAVKSTIQHWQLRDLISCPNSRSEFIHVNQNNISSFNTKTKESTAILKEMTFAPTSITEGCGYLAAGGQRSQLVVRQLSSTWLAQTTVGGSINNALCISNHPRSTTSGDTRLLVCNNDETIKVYSLPSLQRITTLGLPTAVNYASVSPDGRRLCAVGDSNQIFLFDVTSSGYYQRIATLTGTNDAGFSCSWNHASEKIAVGSQDGFVSVWDIRFINTSNAQTSPSSSSSGVPESSIPFPIGHQDGVTTNYPPFITAAQRRQSSGATSRASTSATFLNKDRTKIACIPSTQQPLVKGAIRSLKFSPAQGGMDLLVFTEHVNYVNFIDARTFENPLSIKVQSSYLQARSLPRVPYDDPSNWETSTVQNFNADSHISGVNWSPDCRSCFVGMENGVLEYEVDTVLRRSFARGVLL